MIADVGKDYRGETKVFLTGFSGGGHPSVSYMLLHPDRLRGAAFSAASANLRCAHGPPYEPKPSYSEPPAPPPISGAADSVRVPVQFFMGSRDATLRHLEGQRDRVVSDAKNHMYGTFASETITGAGHEPMIEQVLGFFHSLLRANER